MIRYTYILLFTLLTGSVFANDLFNQANQAYNDKDYEKAAVLYDSILSKEKSFEVYYNLGNAYFKLQQLPKAILMYESAKLIKPNDEDLNDNIKYAREMLQIEQKPMVKELGDVINNFSTWTIRPIWQWIAILFLIFTCILLFVFFKSTKNTNKRAFFFYASLLSFFIMISAYFLSYRQQKTLFKEEYGIVMDQAIQVYGEPSESSNESFEISSGYKVQILDEVDGWYEISINNGNIGWTAKKNIALISLKN